MTNEDTHGGRVADEDATALLPLLQRFVAALRPVGDGTMSGHIQLERVESPPIVRALMRVEAELLMHDAGRVTAESGSWRTPGERRLDALLLLMLRTVAAVDGQPIDARLTERYLNGDQGGSPAPDGTLVASGGG